ncbi:MAG TPA: hypothetical protein VF028_03135 [Actinomycetota bacterium]|nr:hypothetical protein [Actinomycetota bacterium]
MQAPTTPNGQPAQDPGQRTCPICGAANGLTAAFCWQCYRPFGAYAAPPGLAGAPGGSSARPDATPFRFPTELEAPRRGGGVSRVAAIVLVTVAVIGGAYWFVSRPDAVTIPESFGGLDRIEGAQTEIVAEAFRAQVEDTGIEGDLALYGDGLPTTALIWIRDASVPTTDAAFDAFASGFDAGIGDEASLDASRRTTETVDGVTFVCAPVLGVTPGTICMWQVDSVFWLLFDFSGQGQQAARSLAVVANDAVRSA